MKKQTIKQTISSFLVSLLTKRSVVVKNETCLGRYIDITIRLPEKKGWIPGEKVQFLINDHELRSYTPYAFDSDQRTFSTLIYDNQKGAGANFVKKLRPKDKLKVHGPTKSLNGQEMRESVLFFADESSLGLAYALKNKVKNFIFECHDLESFEQIAREKFQIEGACYIKRGPSLNHLQSLNSLLANHQGDFYLTGHKDSVQWLFKKLIDLKVSPERIFTKVYWGKHRR